jgi:hypothetical protein
VKTNTTRQTLLRFGTTTVAYAAGAALVTGGMALASQAKGADMTGVARFPQHRVSGALAAYAKRPAFFASPYDEAIFHIRSLRAERNATTPAERQHHVAIIALKWWEGELARIVASRSTAQEAR